MNYSLRWYHVEEPAVVLWYMHVDHIALITDCMQAGLMPDGGLFWMNCQFMLRMEYGV